jgi:hypothetical protein
MANRVSFSGDHLGLLEIAAHHQDLESSLALYFSAASPSFLVRFAGYAATEVTDGLGERLDEADLTSSLTVLAAVEAAFRIDYLQRCYRRGRDPVSRAFRKIYRAKQQHASLEDEIFEAWIDNSYGARSIIGELRGAFKFRHWLAHGRYWTPKLGRRYGFNDVFALADLVLRSFPFYEFGAR